MTGVDVIQPVGDDVQDAEEDGREHIRLGVLADNIGVGLQDGVVKRSCANRAGHLHRAQIAWHVRTDLQ